MNFKEQLIPSRTINAIDSDGNPREITEFNVLISVEKMGAWTPWEPSGNGPAWFCGKIELMRVSETEFQSDYPPLALRIQE